MRHVPLTRYEAIPVPNPKNTCNRLFFMNINEIETRRWT